MRDLPPLDVAAMVSFFVSGGLAICFGLFSILGTLMGGAVAIGGMTTGSEEAFIGGFIFVFYGMWMVVCLVAGSLHLFAGFQLSRGAEKGIWLVAACFGGLALAITVYCAPFGVISAALGLASFLTQPTED